MSTTVPMVSFPAERAPGCPFDPSPSFRRLQQPGSLARVKLWDGSTPWLITRYDQARTLLGDRRLSSDTDQTGYPHASAAARQRRKRDKPFLVLDDPEHGRQRRMISSEFLFRNMQALRPRIQDHMDKLIDQMEAGPRPVDLVQALSLPFPLLVICELLGVPFADRARFQELGNTITTRGVTPDVMMAATEGLLAYLCELVDRKDAAPEDDLLSRLAVDHVRTGAISREAAANMGLMLLLAGHETTANMISLGTVLLLRDPDRLAEIRTTQDQDYIARTVEELLRILTVAHSGLRRVAIDDIEVGGQLIRKGEGIIIAVDAANRDEEAFPEPGTIDIDRANRQHLAFGHGIHICVGQTLARVELQVVLGTLYRRLPGLRLAVPFEQLEFKHDMTIYGLHELPVTW